MKVSTLVIGLVLVSLMVFTMSQYIVDVNSNYGVTVDNSTLSAYDKMSELSDVAEDAKDEVNNVKENPDVIDKLSSFVISGYTAFKTMFVSADIATDVARQGVVDLNLDRSFRTAIETILIISIFVGIAIAAIFKWRV